MKLVSVSFAAVLWLFFAFKIENVSRTFTIPVEYRNIPKYCMVENPKPMQVQVALSGVERAFSFDPSALAVSLDMGGTVDGVRTVPVDENDLNLPAGIKLQHITPRTITVSAQRYSPVDLPVKLIY
jgi:hypothetical protein